MEDAHQSFLRDLVAWLRIRAKEAKTVSQDGSGDRDFEAGRTAAYVEVLGHMQSQADVFLLNKKGVGLESFDAYDLGRDSGDA